VDTRALLSALETAGIRYLVVGGVAATLLGREKDRAVLPLYRSTLAERARRSGPP